MADKKKPEDDLLEGFDDAFDDELDQAFGGPSPSGEKTEFFEKDSEKTEFAPKENNNEKTQVNLLEEEEPAQVESFSMEPTRGAYQSQVPTEDLSGLFQEPQEIEGQTDDPTTFEATRNSIGNQEGKTEIFEPPSTENLAAMIDSDLLEASGPISPGPSANKPKANPNAGDLSSLIEEEISGEEGQEGKTEDISSLIDSEVIEPSKSAPARFDRKMPEPPAISQPAKSIPKKDVSKSAAQDDLSYMRSEQSKTVRVWTKKQKTMLMAGLGVGCIAIAGGFFMVLNKMKSGPAPTDPAATSTTEAPVAAQPEKVVESAELLKELEEKYAQTAQYFVTDRFQSYTEATNRLEEILATYPNHKKANARLAEAILLKFDGYLDNERKNRVYQLLQKAEELEPNSVETLRTKARMLMVEGKIKDAAVRVDQAIALNPNDADALQTQGEILMADGNAKAAMASFAKVLGVQNNSVRAKYFLNLAKEKMGDLKGAKAGFAELITDMNAHPKSIIEKYAIAMNEGNFAKTKAELEQYLTEKDKDLSPLESAKGWQVIANALLKQNNKPGAIEALEKSVSKMALDHKTTFELGNLYFAQKDFQKASQHYSTSVTLDPENVDYLLQLGICLREQGRLKEAEEQLKKVTSKAPKKFDGLYQYAYTKYKLGYADEVMTQLNQNIKDNPQFIQGKILLGTIQVEKNDFKNAFQNFLAALSAARDKETSRMALMAMGDFYLKQELWTKAKQFYTQAATKDPENYDIHFALAKIDIQLNQINDAQGHLRQMQKINPASVEAKVLQAGILVEKEEYDKAIEVYKDVLKTRESDYETRISLAKVLMEKKEFAQALQELVQAYKYNADYYYTYYYMGLANRGVGDLAESERNLNKAIELMPKFYKAHYELGLTLLHKDEVGKGTAEMKQALELEPSFIEAMTALGDYYYDHSGFKEADQYYQQALKIQPNRPDVMLKLAKNYHEMGDDKKSIKLFQKILQLKPTSASIYYELGVLFEENNDPPQALRMYQKSLSLSPKDPRPYYQLGFLYKDLKQNAKAVAAFKNFLNYSPNAAEKKDIEDEIARLGGK